VRELGPTVVNQAQYLMDADIVDLRTLRVNGSLPWARTNLDKLWELEAGYGFVRDAPGAFAQGEDAQSGRTCLERAEVGAAVAGADDGGATRSRRSARCSTRRSR
jgi:hypothetical protein